MQKHFLAFFDKWNKKEKKEKLVSLQKTCVVLWMYVNTPESSA